MNPFPDHPREPILTVCPSAGEQLATVRTSDDTGLSFDVDNVRFVTPTRETTFRFLASPSDIGSGVQIHTGRILEWIDKAAYAQAATWSGGYAVTAYVGNVRFATGIDSGELVEVSARLIHTGTSSMHIQCDVRAADPFNLEFRHCAECLVIFISMSDGRPASVPKWLPSSRLEVHESQEAEMRIGMRKDIEVAMSEQVYSDDSTAPHTMLRFLATPQDVNWGGNVHGGRLMGWIDDAANLCAKQWSATVCTSVYAGGVRFYRPIHIGHVVEVQARLIHTGHETMHISIHVRSGEPTSPERMLTTHCLTVCAALGVDGSPTPVRQWVPVSEEDKALDAHARDLIRLRKRGAFSQSPAL